MLQSTLLRFVLCLTLLYANFSHGLPVIREKSSREVGASSIGAESGNNTASAAGTEPVNNADDQSASDADSAPESEAIPIDVDLLLSSVKGSQQPVANYTATKLTYYWIKYQKPTDVGTTELRSCDGKTVFGTSSRKFATQLRMEGTGHLLNGKILNLGNCNCGDGTNTFNCFMDLTNVKRAPFGFGVQNLPLTPFVSVANNDKNRKIGSKLYAPDFDGIRLPNGKIHDGCMIKVDAIGRGGKASHIDVFALTEQLAYDLFMEKVKKDIIPVEWDSPRCANSKLTYNITPSTDVSL